MHEQAPPGAVHLGDLDAERHDNSDSLLQVHALAARANLLESSSQSSGDDGCADG
jgi:hypothetical protein